MLALPRRAFALDTARSLRFEHAHTGETFTLTAALGGPYLLTALEGIRHFLRDFRNGATHAIDPGLLDQLQRLAEISGTRAPFQVISGYRSVETNETLRREGHGAAAHSLHLEGRAIDIRLADVALAELRDAALSLKAGGVGYYPSADSNFVHIDTGRVRHW